MVETQPASEEDVSARVEHILLSYAAVAATTAKTQPAAVHADTGLGHMAMEGTDTGQQVCTDQGFSILDLRFAAHLRALRHVLLCKLRTSPRCILLQPSVLVILDT